MTTNGMAKRNILAIVIMCAAAVVSVYSFRWWSERQTAKIAVDCKDAVENERWDEAEVLADQWVRRAPEDADAWLNLAEVAKQRGDLEATSECLSHVPTTDRRYLKSQMLRGDLTLDGLKRPYEAIAIWKEMLAVAPNANVAHQRLIYVYSMTLQRELLVTQIREAIHQRAEPPEAYGYILAAPNLVFSDGYLRVGQWLQATPNDETLRVAVAVFAARTNPSRGMKMFGTKAVEAGNANGVEECLKDYPDNLELRAFVIEKIIADGDMSALGKSLKKLPKSAELDTRFWRYIGTYRDSQRLSAEAAEAFQKSLQLHPMNWKSHHELGTVARVLGNMELAAKHADLGSRGKELERTIHELPNAAEISTDLLMDLLKYAEDCGDEDVVEGLRFRLNVSPGAP